MYSSSSRKRPRPPTNNHPSKRYHTSNSRVSSSSSMASSSSSMASTSKSLTSSTTTKSRETPDEIYRESVNRDKVCTMCSDSQKTRRHPHFSTTSLRRTFLEQKGDPDPEQERTFKCPICKSLELCLVPPSQTRRILLTDSTMYGVWNKTLPKNIIHFDMDSIVGGRIQDLTTALMKNYLHLPNRAEIIVMAGINNIGDGDTANQIIRNMRVMKQIVKEHSMKWKHVPPSYVSFCTVPLAPKFCSLFIPTDPRQPEALEWVPPPNFNNRYVEIKKLNDSIIQLNQEEGQDLKNVRVDYHGVKRPRNGNVQHRWDNKPGCVPVWREEQVFRKLHFVMDIKVKMMGFISKCFEDNSAEKVAEQANHD